MMWQALSQIKDVDAIVYCNEEGGVIRQEIRGTLSARHVRSALDAMCHWETGFRKDRQAFQKLALKGDAWSVFARPHQQGYLVVIGQKGLKQSALEKAYKASQEPAVVKPKTPKRLSKAERRAVAKDPKRVVIEEIRMPWRAMIAAVALTLICGTIGLMSVMPGGVSSSDYVQPALAVPAPASPKTMLTLHGSNTIGADMGPALAEAFLQGQGAKTVRRIPGANPVEVGIEGRIPGKGLQRIEIAAHGSTTGFKGLDAEACDIGMASRPIKGKEVTKLQRFGDMKRPGAENVVAMDGIAVIVHPQNGVSALSVSQIAALFSGEITNWAQIPGSGIDAPVHVFARDANSGTWDTFKGLVLKSRKKKLTKSAKRFEDSEALSHEVSQAAGGIGFIGLPYIKPSKAVKVYDEGTEPVYPTLFSVATEDYLLARRLYVYVPPSLQNEKAREFVHFALSNSGQMIAEKTGFVRLGVFEQSIDAASLKKAPKNYRDLTHGANRLSLNFRFRPGSDRPDTKALRDMDRMIEYLGQEEHRGRKLRLLGFADGRVPKAEACGLAQRRAEQVAKVFEAYGIESDAVQGFCSAMPVASNRSEKTAIKNNRVEIWIEKKS